jgi:hypothetical protein
MPWTYWKSSVGQAGQYVNGHIGQQCYMHSRKVARLLPLQGLAMLEVCVALSSKAVHEAVCSNIGTLKLIGSKHLPPSPTDLSSRSPWHCNAVVVWETLQLDI